MNEQAVRFDCTDGIGVITFDRPPANAYDLVFHRQFDVAIEMADTDAGCRVVVLRSAVPRFFCAGADIKVFSANSTADNREMVAAAQAALAKIEASGKIFIACLQGHTLGGGLEIAMACDMRLAAEGEYKLGLPEAKLGLLPGNGGSQRLPRLVGASQAILLLTSGESIGPGEALRIGLVDQLLPADAFEDEVTRIARAIAESAPLAVTACKRSVQGGRHLELKDALALEVRLLDELYDTDDAAEGFRAFVEKRAPEYTGK
jgi:enoyl-CoA hydratase/carnithine racemase